MQYILGLHTIPSYREAEAHGVRIKMLGSYPALVRNADVRSSDAMVKGRVYVIETADHFEKLKTCEGNAYEVVGMLAEVRVRVGGGLQTERKSYLVSA